MRRFALVMTASLAAIAAILSMQPGSVDLAAILHIQPQLDLAPLARAPLLVQVHLLTVLYALLVGPIQFLLPKGTRLHRVLGWSWALAMLVTALASLGIREINHGQFSPIHLFSAWTLASLPLAVIFARRGAIQAHRGTMVGLYVGLVIAGLLAIAPGRLFWDIFFG
ncbi:MAG: DUF2306 domain-containing protein [Caulobacteraceae bacterium]|nr:DUF2306 domain-containing protein [Caulobacteraceae bacterium]